MLNRLRHRSRVEMILSAGEHAAGESYSLPYELADQYIARGYAKGEYSREYTDQEIVDLRGTPQVVSL